MHRLTATDAPMVRYTRTIFPSYAEYETVAMGDSENDLPMLEYADISIAMGNGVKEVKEKADYVTDKIDNDGLYKAFKYLKLF